MTFTYATVCSGIEAPSVAWVDLGWTPLWFSEIEPAPCRLLAYRYPTIPNHGDMRRLARRILLGDIETPDLLFAGTPCQAFSVAGLREGLADERGNLTLAFARLCDAIDHVRARAGKPACIIGWENVPGVLTSQDNAFGGYLAGLVGGDAAVVPGARPVAEKSSRDWRWSQKRGTHVPRWPAAGGVAGPRRAVAWRCLDAQYLGLAQRRERVFLVASARRGFDPSAVLFEFDGVRRDSAPCREARQSAAALFEDGARTSGECSVGEGPLAYGGLSDRPRTVATTLTAHAGHRCDFDTETFIAVHGTQDPCTSNTTGFALGRNRGQENVIAFSCKNGGADASEVAPTLRALGHDASHANAGGQLAVAYDLKQITSPSDQSRPKPGGPCHTRARSGAASAAVVQHPQSIRRLTPIECERLQGFPDDYTRTPLRFYQQRRITKARPDDRWERVDDGWMLMEADGPRYKMLGNSIATNCLRWLGERIALEIKAA